MSADPALLVAPFRGERYADRRRLSALVAPPYDVISDAERSSLAALDEHNIVHVMLPEAASGGGDRYARAGALLAAWRDTGALVRDEAPAVYVMAQDFALPSGERRTRIGMFAAVVAEPYETGRVRPHERTHSGPKADRLALLEATETNVESIFLLAPDPDRALAAALREATRPSPAGRAEQGGVRIRLWVVGGDAASRLAALASSPLYIADGHHRYETAVTYRKAHPAADRVLAFIVPAADPGLALLPTHRLVYGSPSGSGLDVPALLAQWRLWFDAGRVAPCADRVERLAELGRERTACVVAFPDAADLSLVLKRDAPLDQAQGIGRTPAVRALDVARIEALVVQPLLAAVGTTPSLGYTPDAREAFDAVRKGRASAAVLLNPTKVEQVIAVADAGDVMPAKSTYFVPKVPSGLVVRPLS